MTYKCDLLITAPAVRGLLVGLEVMLPLIVLLTSYFAIHRRVKKSKALLDGFSSKKCDRYVSWLRFFFFFLYDGVGLVFVFGLFRFVV